MERYDDTKKASIFGIIGNVFLLILKSIIGLITGSQAMIADAANSAGDIFASLMTFIGNKIASEPRDETHNFGHGKAEYLFSLFISIAMIFVSIKLLFDSITSLIEQQTFTFSCFLLIVCFVTILIKSFLFLYTKNLYKKFDNILLKANMQDHRNDCIVTTFTLIAVILSIFNIYWFDGVVGIGISLWIAYTGIKIFIESYNILMDVSIDEKTKDHILHLIHTYPEIKQLHHFHSSPVGYKYIIVLNIAVDGNMSTFDSHHLADQLETDIKKLTNIYDVIIHVDPV